ncbi:MAG: extracellular solute-binding protein, partial [Anaerolineae bacterium]|nr:extracellular solute-binding protein [Anaerolineae bacterium]
SWDPDNAYKPMIEEAVGIQLEYRMVPSAEYVEVRNVTMASGDLPDAVRVGPRESVYAQYVDNGLLRQLDDLLEKYPAVRDAYSADIWEANRYSDGHIYHIPRITGFYPITIAYRKDWADKLGIAQPTTTAEFQAMLQAFKDQDPGGLGDAMIPFVPNRLSGSNFISWIDPVLSPFGVNYMSWVPSPDDPTQLVLSHTLPSFKEALAYARDLYNAGLLDQTWGVSEERGLFKFYAGIVGATSDWPQYDHLRLEAIQTAFPDANAAIAYITGLIGPDGTQGGPLLTPNSQDLGSALTTAATDEEADAFFRMLAWQYTDGYQLMSLGVEGKTFDVGEDGIARRRGRDSVLEKDPAYDLYMLDRVFFAEPPFYFDYSRQNPTWNDVSDDMFSYVSSVLSAVNDVAVINYGVNTNDPAIADNLQAIQSVVDEFTTRAILTPDFNMDTEFPAFVEKLDQNNLPAVTEAMNRLNAIDQINSMVAGS